LRIENVRITPSVRTANITIQDESVPRTEEQLRLAREPRCEKVSIAKWVNINGY
jgi:hypothetical protein